MRFWEVSARRNVGGRANRLVGFGEAAAEAEARVIAGREF